MNAGKNSAKIITGAFDNISTEVPGSKLSGKQSGTNPAAESHKLCLAPMLKYTDRHYRYMLRLLSPDIRLYTEMITTGAIIHGDRNRFLSFSKEEHPVALQVGGSKPDEMQKVTEIADAYGYDEVNINVGCPSDRVQSGQFGACLMAYPDKVAACVEAMQQVTDKPVTVKTRIGIDDSDEFSLLQTLVEAIRQAGCKTVLVHARKAWLEGLSPKENRDIPPLNYPRVYQLKKDFPDLKIIINGGVRKFHEIESHLQNVDGVMVGRRLIDEPWVLVKWQQQLFDKTAEHSDVIGSKSAFFPAYLEYANQQMKDYQIPARQILRHLLPVMNGEKGAKQWRQFMSNHLHRDDCQHSTQWIEDYISRYTET